MKKIFLVITLIVFLALPSLAISEPIGGIYGGIYGGSFSGGTANQNIVVPSPYTLTTDILNIASGQGINITNAVNANGFDILLSGDANAVGYIINRAAAGLSFGTNNTERVVIDENGAITFSNSVLTAPPITIKEIDGHAALSLTAAQVSGTNIYNTGQGPNNVNHTLPACAAGYNFNALVGESQAASYWRFTAGTAGTMCLDGTCGKDYVSFATPVQGNALSCVTMPYATTGLTASAALAIGSTPTAVASGAFTFDIAGTGYSKSAVAAGTAPGNDTIPQNKYGAVAFEIGADGTIDAIEATDNATGYDTALLAVAGLPVVAASHTRMGYVTAMSTEAGGFVFGTTSLAAANTTVAYTSTTAYTKPYYWNCFSISGAVTTN